MEQTQSTRKTKHKTPEDFRAMETPKLEELLAEYREIKRLGVLPKHDNRWLTPAEVIRLNFYISIIEGVLKARGVAHE